MNNNKLNIDAYTQNLIKMSGVEEPSKNFTKNVMGQILKDPAVNVSFITKDDKNSNLWLILSIAIMVIGYSVFYIIKNGFSVSSKLKTVDSPEYFKFFTEFFTNLFQELSLSPYIFIALLGVVILVVMDKTIIRYLYSI
jgi:hypothetical protein